MKEMIGYATMGLLTFDLICIIIAIAIRDWVALDNDTLTFNTGLWRQCYKQYVSAEKCDTIDEPTDGLKTVRAMMLLGLFLTLGALVTVVLKQFVFKEKKEVLYGTAVSLLLAALFLLVGWAHYHADVFKDITDVYEDAELHAGFAFAIISWILTSCGVGLSVLMIFMENKEAGVSAST